MISIHKALAGLDIADLQAQIDVINFNPHGPRGPRPLGVTASCIFPDDFNPQGPRGPRPPLLIISVPTVRHFNPQGPRGPRLAAG